MKKSILYIVLVVSIVVNIILLCVFLPKSCTGKEDKEPDFSNMEIRQETAEVMAKKLVCENLYYPESYDPVNTTVDSAFFNYLTDADCLNAAVELIDLRNAYEAAKSSYEENDWTIRFHGNPGGAFLEHERNARAEAAAEMKELQPQIEKQQEIIRNRSTARDGNFFGWQVVHRYRASNSAGVVSFGNELFILDPTMSKCYFRFSLDENEKNLKSIRMVIENELAISSFILLRHQY